MKSAQILRIARTGHETANSGVFFAKSDFRGRGTPLTTHCSKFPGNFWKSRNFEAPNTQILNKNAPELSVSGTALTILKFWAKTITFQESYGESKFGSQTLFPRPESSALKLETSAEISPNLPAESRFASQNQVLAPKNEILSGQLHLIRSLGPDGVRCSFFTQFQYDSEILFFRR